MRGGDSDNRFYFTGNRSSSARKHWHRSPPFAYAGDIKETPSVGQPRPRPQTG